MKNNKRMAVWGFAFQVAIVCHAMPSGAQNALSERVKAVVQETGMTAPDSAPLPVVTAVAASRIKTTAYRDRTKIVAVRVAERRTHYEVTGIGSPVNAAYFPDTYAIFECNNAQDDAVEQATTTCVEEGFSEFFQGSFGPCEERFLVRGMKVSFKFFCR